MAQPAHFTEAGEVLEDLLHQRLTDETPPEEVFSAAFDAFREFASMPFSGTAPLDEDGDAILVEYGTYSFRGQPEFSIDLTRQFIEPGDDGEMYQLHCSLYWEPSELTEALGSDSLWSMDQELPDYFNSVAELPGLTWAFNTKQMATGIELSFEEV